MPASETIVRWNPNDFTATPVSIDWDAYIREKNGHNSIMQDHDSSPSVIISGTNELLNADNPYQVVALGGILALYAPYVQYMSKEVVKAYRQMRKEMKADIAEAFGYESTRSADVLHDQRRNLDKDDVL